MAFFWYQAFSKDGKRISGLLEASNQQAVRENQVQRLPADHGRVRRLRAQLGDLCPSDGNRVAARQPSGAPAGRRRAAGG